MKLTAGLLAAVIAFDASFISIAEAKSLDDFWQNRQRSSERLAAATDTPLVASLPALPAAALTAAATYNAAKTSDLARPLPLPALSELKGGRRLTDLVATLPANAGTLRAARLPQGAATRVVLHVQDVHLNSEAQLNIAKAMCKLMPAGGAGVVGLEGAFGPIDVARFQSYPNKSTVERIGRFLVKQGQISGPVFAALTTANCRSALTGVDDAALHHENVEAYLAARGDADTLKSDVAARRRDLSARKAAAFTRPLLSYDAAVNEYRDGGRTLVDHIAYLVDRVPEAGQDLRTFREAAKLEAALDFEKIEEERTQVLSTLAQKLSEEDVTRLIARSLSYRAGEIRHAAFYGYLRGLCQRSGVSLAKTPAFDDYLRYVALTDGIDGQRLLDEMAAAEEAGYDRLATTEAQKALLREDRLLALASRMSDFALTPEEWALYVRLKGGSPAAVDGLPVEAFESFYAAAKKRDAALAKNLLAAMDKAGADTAVLVSGGFHSSGVDQRLLDAGTAVLTFSPRLTRVKDSDGTGYLGVFAQEKTPLQVLFEGPKLFLSPPPAQFDQAGVLAAALDRPADPATVLAALTPGVAVEARIEETRDTASGSETVMTVVDNARRDGRRLTIRFSAKDILSVASAPLGWIARVKRRAVLGLVAVGLLAGSVPPAAIAQTARPTTPPAATRSAPVVTAPKISKQTPAAKAAAPAPSRNTALRKDLQETQAYLRQLRKEAADSQKAQKSRLQKLSQSIAAIEARLKGIETAAAARQAAEEKARKDLVTVTAELEKNQKDLDAAATKAVLPEAQIAAAATSLGELKVDAAVADVKALLDLASPGGAVDQKLRPVFERLTALQAAQDALSAVRPGATLTPAERDAFIGFLENGITAASGQTGDAELIRGAAEDLKVLGVPGDVDGLSKAAATAVERVSDGKPAAALGTVRDSVRNWNSAAARLEALQSQRKDLERRKAAAERTISNAPVDKYFSLSKTERRTLADRIVPANQDFNALAEEAAALHGGLKQKDGAWGDALSSMQEAFTTLAAARAKLLDDNASTVDHITAARSAIDAWRTVRRKLSAFDSNHPDYQSQLSSLPVSADTVPEIVRRHYRDGAGVPEADADALAIYYGRAIDRMAAVFASGASVDVLNGLISIVENRLNIPTRDEAMAADAQRRAGETQELAAARVALQAELDRLINLGKSIESDAAAARAKAPNAQARDASYRPDTARVDAYAGALDRLAASLKEEKGLRFTKDGADLEALFTEMRAAVDGYRSGSVNPDRLLATIILSVQHIDDWANPDKISSSGKKDVSDEHIKLLSDIINQSASLGLVWQAGLTDAQIRAGVTAEDTLENRAMRAAAAFLTAPETARDARKNLHAMEKNAKWGIMDALNAANVLLGLFNIRQEINTALGKPAPFTVIDGKKVGPLIPAVSGPSIILAVANLGVNVTGAEKEARLAVTGERPEAAIPYYAAVLDEKNFNGLTWTVETTPGAEVEGRIYYRSGALAMNAPARTKATGGNWREADRGLDLQGRFYRIEKGKTYVWVAGDAKASPQERVNAVLRAARAADLAHQILRGFSAQRAGINPTVLTRFNAVLNFISTIDGLFHFMDAVQYKRTLRSEQGGYVNVPSPSIRVRMTVVLPDGTTIPLAGTKDGMLLVRRDNKWDSIDGVPVYRLGTGRWKFSLNRFFFKSDQMYQPSIRQGKKYDALSTADFGTLFRRVPDSAPMTVSAQEGKFLVTTQVFGLKETYLLGDPVDGLVIDGKKATGRPIYSIRNGQPGDLKGVVIDYTPRSGDTIDTKKVYGYIGSLPERVSSFLAEIGAQAWQELNPEVQGPILRSQLPAYDAADARWTRDLDGLQHFKDGDARWVRWQDASGTILIDLNRKLMVRQWTDGDGAHVSIRAESIPDAVRTRDRGTRVGDWVQDSDRPTAEMPPRANAFPLEAGAPAKAWIDVRGDLILSVERTWTANGRTFAPGTYRYEIGGAGVERARAAMSAPFYRRAELPLNMDLAGLYDADTDIRHERVRPDGARETWYVFSASSKRARTVDTSAAYVRVEKDGRAITERVTLAGDALAYQLDTADKPFRWGMMFSAPDGLTWEKGDVPPALAGRVPAGSRADYALDGRHVLLRLNTPDGSEITFILDGNPNAPVTGGLRPFADALPAGIAAALSEASNGDLIKVGDIWSLRWATVPAVQKHIADLETRRFVVINDTPLTALQAEFARSGRPLKPQGPAGLTIPFGGMPFTPFATNLDPTNAVEDPGTIALVAAKDGTFRHPETGETVGLSRGDILILESGFQALDAAEARERSARPHLERVFASAAMIRAMHPGRLIESTDDAARLPATLGTGATEIPGRWFGVKGDDGRTQYVYFEVGDVGPNGRTFVDTAGIRQTVETGSLWVIKRTAAGARANAAFENGVKPAWAVAEGPADRTVFDNAPLFTIPGGVEGRLSVGGDAAATTLLVTAGGTIDDPVAGRVNVAPGDVLVYRTPVGLQRAFTAARQGTEPIWVPSIAPLGTVKAGYEARPANGKPRRLVSGALAAKASPNLPAGVTANVWIDPANEDAPIVLEIASVPEMGTEWTLPGTNITVRLEAGMTFVREMTSAGLAAQAARERDAESPILEEMLWTPGDVLKANAGNRPARRFETKVDGLRASLIEDLSNPNTRRTIPSLDLVIFHEDGTLRDGTVVRAGVLYRRRSSLARVRRDQRKAQKDWGRAIRIGPASLDPQVVELPGPVMTRIRYLDAKRPFDESGRPNLVRSGKAEDAVDVFTRNGVDYIVEGAPLPTAGVVFDIDSGRGEEISVRGRFNVPSLTGVTVASSLSFAERTMLKLRGVDLQPGTLVRRNGAGDIDAVVVLGPDAVAWLAERKAGFGYVQIDRNLGNVRLLGEKTSRRLNGWVAFGPEGSRGGLTIPWDVVARNLRPANGKDGRKGWLLVDANGRRLGTVTFGLQAPAPSGNIFVDVNPRTGAVTGTRPVPRELAGKPVTGDVRNHLRTVVQARDNRWVWAVHINGAWRLVQNGRVTPSSPAVDLKNSVDPARPIWGIVDAGGRVTGFIGMKNPGEAAAMKSLSAPANGRWTVDDVTFDRVTGAANVRLVDRATGEVVIDSYQSDIVESRTYLDQRGAPAGRVIFGPSGERQPLRLETPDGSRWKTVETYEVKLDRSFTYPRGTSLAGRRVSGDLVIARDPGTGEERHRSLFNSAGRAIWTRRDTLLTVNVFDAAGRPAESATYDRDRRVMRIIPGQAVRARTAAEINDFPVSRTRVTRRGTFVNPNRPADGAKPYEVHETVSFMFGSDQPLVHTQVWIRTDTGETVSRLTRPDGRREWAPVAMPRPADRIITGSRGEELRIFGTGDAQVREVWVSGRLYSVTYLHKQRDPEKSQWVTIIHDTKSNPDAPVALFTMSANQGLLNNVVTVGRNHRTGVFFTDTDGRSSVDIFNGRRLIARAFGPFAVFPMERQGILSGLYSNLPNVLARVGTRVRFGGVDLTLRAEDPLSSAFIKDGRVMYPDLTDPALRAQRLTDSEKTPASAETRPMDWKANAPSTLSITPAQVANKLLALRRPGSRLIPTATIGGPSEPYIDTAYEANMIEFLARHGHASEALEMLKFYVEQSRGGQRPLASFYSSDTGEPVYFNRARNQTQRAEITSAEQVAMARAAFRVAAATGDRDAVALAWRLTARVLEFRPDPAKGGISVQQPVSQLSLGFLGRARAANHGFTTMTNANALELFEIADGAARAGLLPAEWNILTPAAVRSALESQRAWMRANVVAAARNDGWVPAGFQELRFPVTDDRSAGGFSGVLTPTPRSAADGWIAFLRVARSLGASRDEIRGWTNRLGSVHAVTVNGRPGLDWTPFYGRPEGDMISVEQTAALLDLARRDGLNDVAAWAASAVSQSLLPSGDAPAVGAVQGGALPADGAETGLGFRVLPGDDDHLSPPALLALGNAVSGENEGPLTAAEKATMRRGLSGTPSVAPGAAEREFFLFAWLAGVVWPALLTAYSIVWELISRLFWSRRRAAANDESATPGPEPAGSGGTAGGTAVATEATATDLIRPEALTVANRLWANDVLWRETLPDGRIELVHGPVEGNFLFSLRFLFAELVEWRLRAGDTTIDASNPWVNSFEKMSIIASLYMRREIFRATFSEDGTHIWNRLEMFFYERRELIRDALARGDLAEVETIMAELGVVEDLDRLDIGGPRDARRLNAMNAVQDDKGEGPNEVFFARVEKELGLETGSMEAFVNRYRAFKQREDMTTPHPWSIEAATLLPPMFMALVGVIFFHNWASLGAGLLPILGGTMGAAFLTPAGFALAGLSAALFLGGLALKAIGTRARRDGKAGAATLLQASMWMRMIGMFGLAAFALFVAPASSFEVFALKSFLGGLAALEGFGYLYLPKVTIGTKTFRDVGFARNRSIVAMSFSYFFRPPSRVGGARLWFNFVSMHVITLAATILMGYNAYGWFAGNFTAGLYGHLMGGATLFLLSAYLLRYGIHVLMGTVASFLALFPKQSIVLIAAGGAMILPAFLPGGPLAANMVAVLAGAVAWLTVDLFQRAKKRSRVDVRAPPADANGPTAPQPNDGKQKLTAVVYMGGDSLVSPAVIKGAPNVDLLMKRWDWLVAQPSLGVQNLELDGVPAPAGIATEFRRLIERASQDPAAQAARVRSLLEGLYRSELAANGGNGMTLWLARQIEGRDPSMPEELVIRPEGMTAEELELALYLRRWTSDMMSSAGQSHNTGQNLAEYAQALHQAGRAHEALFILAANRFNNDPTRPAEIPTGNNSETGQRAALIRLIEHVTDGQATGRVVYDWTPFGFKSAGMTGMDALDEYLPRIDTLQIMDRNAVGGHIEGVVRDFIRMRSNPKLVVIVPRRATTNTHAPVGQASRMVEEGHAAAVAGLMSLMGGHAAEGIGTGWMNFMRSTYWNAVTALASDASQPTVPLTTRLAAHRGFMAAMQGTVLGMIGFAEHAPGISEDIWAVQQQAHTQIGLGGEVEYAQGEDDVHKIRESFTHSAWFAAYPRWSGGNLNLEGDRLMQIVMTWGPLSIFGRELRRGNSRFFGSVPFAFINLAIMPIAIMWGFSPFQGVDLAFWLVGTYFSQVLTAHGLIATMRASGFSRAIGAGGAIAVVALGGSLPLAAVAFVAAGFLTSFAKWLPNRVFDMLLFAPQLMAHLLGQILEATFKFVPSGGNDDPTGRVRGAPKQAYERAHEHTIWKDLGEWVRKSRAEAKPGDGLLKRLWANKPAVTSLFWVMFTGLVLLGLDVTAILRLDVLNALMLYPALMFSIGLLFGPFIMQVKPGESLGRVGTLSLPFLDALPRIVGWTLGVAMLAGFSLGFGIAPAFGWTLGTLALAATVLPGILYERKLKKDWDNKWDELSKSRRFYSDIGRVALAIVASVIWFHIVPVSAEIQFSVLGREGGIDSAALFDAVLKAFGALGALFAVGKAITWGQLFSLSRRRARVEARLAENRPRLSQADYANAKALLINAATYAAQESPALMRKAIDEAEAIVNRGNPPSDTTRGGPTSGGSGPSRRGRRSTETVEARLAGAYVAAIAAQRERAHAGVATALVDILRDTPLSENLSSADGRALALDRAARGVDIDGESFGEELRRAVSESLDEAPTLDESLAAVYDAATAGAESRPLVAEMSDEEISDRGITAIVVTESMLARTPSIVALVRGRMAREHIVFIAESEAVQDALLGDLRSGDRASLIVGKGLVTAVGDGPAILKLSALEDALRVALSDEVLSSATALRILSPAGLTIDPDGADGDLFRQAVFLLIDEQLHAVRLEMGTLERLADTARVIWQQA